MGKATSSKGQFITYPRVVPAGDSAILIEVGSEIDLQTNSKVFVLARLIKSAGMPAVSEIIPSYRSLLVNYDPLVTRYDEMLEKMIEIVVQSETVTDHLVESKTIELPVVYGGEYGPDINTVADHAGLSIPEVIDIHSATDYRVYMIGFAPGFPYLGGLDKRIATPRLKTPRIEVPAGSVGIADTQTGVYPHASPGGWLLIGRTTLKLFDMSKSDPSLITSGSTVRFIPVK